LSISYAETGEYAFGGALFAVMPPAAVIPPALATRSAAPTADLNELAPTAITRMVATAQVMSPCAVSRKSTSCACVPIQRVRNLPAI